MIIVGVWSERRRRQHGRARRKERLRPRTAAGLARRPGTAARASLCCLQTHWELASCPSEERRHTFSMVRQSPYPHLHNIFKASYLLPGSSSKVTWVRYLGFRCCCWLTAINMYRAGDTVASLPVPKGLRKSFACPYPQVSCRWLLLCIKPSVTAGYPA